MLYSLKDETKMLRNTYQCGQQFRLLCQRFSYTNQVHAMSYRVLFFGTDDYATRCLKAIVGNMKCSNEKMISKLEVNNVYEWWFVILIVSGDFVEIVL